MPVTLVVEDGTSKVNANTFADATWFQSYCNDHGLSLTAYPAGDVQNTALILAAEYLRNEERYAYRGTKTSDLQRLPWPRTGVVVLYGSGQPLLSTYIPTAVKDAQSELAYRALSAVIQPDLERGGGIQSVSAAGVSVAYRSDAMRETLIQVAQGALKPYLRRYFNLPMAPFAVLDLRTYDDESSPLTAVELHDGVQTADESPLTPNNPLGLF